MERTLDGRVAFVTGGWHGLGAAITDRLVSRGAAVGVGYRRPDPDVDEFFAERAGHPITLHHGSLTEPADCRRTIAELVEQRGRLDVLVAQVNFRNAGLLSIRRGTRSLTDGEWERAITGHLSGAFHLAQAALEHMTAARFGRLVFVLGYAGVHDLQGHFAAVRGGLGALAAELAREVAGSGVTVNQVATGLLADEILADLPEEALAATMRNIPVGRPAELAEVARVVEFLADPECGYLTGQLIAVDGGLTL